MSGTTSAVAAVQDDALVVELLRAALDAATAEAFAARDELTEAGVVFGHRREWAEERVDDLGTAITERSSWTGDDLAQHDAEHVDPARAVVALWASREPIAAYEAAVTIEQTVAALRFSSAASDRAERDLARRARRALDLACATTTEARLAVALGVSLAGVEVDHRVEEAIRGLADWAGSTAVAAATPAASAPVEVEETCAAWNYLGVLLEGGEAEDDRRDALVGAATVEALLRELATVVARIEAAARAERPQGLAEIDAALARLDEALVLGATEFFAGGWAEYPDDPPPLRLRELARERLALLDERAAADRTTQEVAR